MKKRNVVGKLVWLRDVRERAARRRLADAHGEEQTARDELEGAVARMTERGQPADIVTPAELRALQIQGFKLQEIVDAAEALHAERVEHLIDSRETWKRAAADRDSAENLQDRRTAEEASRVRAAAERALDDLQVTRRRRTS